MKYIVLRTQGEDPEWEIPVIFPKELVHQHVAEAVATILRTHHQIDAQPVAAGECAVRLPRVGGNSESLKLASRPQDKILVETHDYLHGLVDEA